MARVRIFGGDRIPAHGAVIVITNHINFFETPLIYSLLRHRHPRAIAKEEAWREPVVRFFAKVWRAIPIKRGAVDKSAFGSAGKVLREQGMVVIAPEGTRSRHGRMQRANAGVVTLAARTGAPVLPIAHWGGESVLNSLAKLKRAIVRVRIGQMMHVDPEAMTSRARRTAELDRIMHSLAALLPEKYRGYYRHKAP